MSLGSAKAQVVDVCAGNDSVVLRLGNFQYGYVQWQVSEDNETWSNIDGAIDTVYTFLPERPRYYRAEVRFPACSEYDYHSQVSYVQVPPKAFAGSDLTIPAETVTRLHATRVEGAEGEWNIIEGSGGTLENPTDCRSGFIGEEGEYKLTWTVTNSCGSNTDTVAIKCVHMEYQPDLVIVDETDAILSDSTQLINGEYIISFNEPVPEIHEGSVLMGYRYPSFLRKVVSFEREGNLFTMQTEAGALTDVILAGALNIDLAVDTTYGRNPDIKYIDRFPTRMELKENPFLFKDGSVYVIKDISKEKAPIDFELVAEITTEGYLSVRLLEFDFKKFDNKLDGLKYSSEMRLYPNFNANIVFENLDFKEATIGFYDARLEHIQRIRLTKPLTTTLVKTEGCFNKTQILLGGFLVFGIPTLVMLDIPYAFKVQASLEPPMSFTKTVGNTYTYEMYYNPQMTVPRQRNEKGEPYQHVTYHTPVGSLGAKFETGFKMSFLLLDILGPYFEVRGNFDPSICASSETGDIGGNINMGVNLSLGCRFQLFSNQLTLFDKRVLDFRVVDHDEPAPKKLLKYRGDNQVYTYGQYLNIPISVKVNGWFNTPMPWAYVHFEPENGSVSESVVTTDIHGIASTRWKPGTQYGMDKLRVKLYDCYGKLVGESPQTFRAYSSASDPCINSNLTVEAYEVNENAIIPYVKGGRRPYQYSTDGEHYSFTQPTIHTEPGHDYHLCVRDANGCEAEAWYNVPRPNCDNTSLRVGASVSGNTVTIYHLGGFGPYQYSIGGNFQNSNVFSDLIDGEYTAIVRDVNGCESSTHVVVYRPGILNISITEINNGSGGAMVMNQTNTLIDRGVCWSTHHNPTVQDLHNSVGPGSGYYYFTITALDPNKTYYVRAYALDGTGTSYSREVCINPNQGSTLPLVASTGVTNVTTTSAYGSGNVTYDGGFEVTERGICWGTGNNPTVAGSHLACGSGTGAFTGEITGLVPNMTYYVRAYATNAAGTAYGNEVSFNTLSGGGGTHEYVDLGLPSGTLWATCNVGANAPEEYGDYFAWGETQPKDVYDWSTYQYCMGSQNTLTKYCNNADYGYNGFTDTLTILLPEDDAATANWGNGWRMPTKEEWEELINNTTHTVTTQNGVIGRLLTASNGNSIFLPAAGYRNENGLDFADSKGRYWSTSLHTNSSYYPVFFNYAPGFFGMYYGSYRYYGQSVRPVRSGNSSHEYVDLGLPSGLLWATCNVGANAPEEYGDYFAWGETQPKDYYDWSTYQYYDGSNPTKYNGNDSLTILLPEDDAATTNWGDGWRMPTVEEWEELYNNTTNTWTTQNGVNGKLFTASNGNSIFLPAAGFRDDDELIVAGSRGCYWSSSLNPAAYVIGYGYWRNAWYFYFLSGYCDTRFNSSRCTGQSVRAVHSASPSAQLPQVTTSEVTDLTTSTATCGGNVVSEGGTTVTVRGVCWSTNHNPTLSDSHASVGAGLGAFVVNATGLASGTTYYVRAYATNAAGTTYGNEVEFSTSENGGTGEVPQGAINGKFTINANGDQVYFSQGNLQYIGSSGTWRFADNQWDVIGTSQGNSSQSTTRDLFGWGTSGYNHGANCYQPWSTSTSYGDYYAYGQYTYNLYDQTGQADWGYNAISNGGNAENSGWRTLTNPEWNYVFRTRNTTSGIRYAKANVNNVNGVILLPDDWDASYYSLSSTNTYNASFSSNILSASQWSTLEQHGAVFLPAAGYRSGTSVNGVGSDGRYWSAPYFSIDCACRAYFNGGFLDTNYSDRYFGFSVRLVRSA